ncbi:IS1182 family transposase [bacterium]|nr:IS1182 family transposase [bacterium]
MKKHSHSLVTFKPYEQHQLMLLPPSLEDLIPKNHQVRVINNIIDKMNIDSLLSTYKGGGTSSYHPRMMLKVLIYAYSQQIYSSRNIGKALRENIHFMWLTGQNQPDFRTINRFRSSHIRGSIEQIFSTVVSLLVESGFIDLKNYFVDGTKVEANANKFSYVWKKSTKRYKEGLQQKVKELFQEIDKINAEEDSHYGDKDLPEMGEDSEIDSRAISERLAEMENQLSKKPENKIIKQAVKKIKDNYLPRQQKYERQEEILQGRNSYSKTDEDATFMRMKDDHLQNGQLKAGYNIQMGTENQFIVGYSVHQNPGDTGLLIPHLEKVKNQLGSLPENIIADSGYGSEENYEYLENQDVTGYVKYNLFHREQKRSFAQEIFRVENLSYDKTTDTYSCPGGKKLSYRETVNYVTDNGYETSRDRYECEDCTGCELRVQCFKGKNNRVITVSHRLNALRKRARDLLLSSKGKEYRSRRPIEVESVFGQLKHNMQFRRFALRGIEKVNIEYGLLSIAHNLKKWVRKLEKNKLATSLFLQLKKSYAF